MLRHEYAGDRVERGGGWEVERLRWPCHACQLNLKPYRDLPHAEVSLLFREQPPIFTAIILTHLLPSNSALRSLYAIPSLVFSIRHNLRWRLLILPNASATTPQIAISVLDARVSQTSFGRGMACGHRLEEVVASEINVSWSFNKVSPA